jgi:hypothetical protein
MTVEAPTSTIKYVVGEIVEPPISQERRIRAKRILAKKEREKQKTYRDIHGVFVNGLPDYSNSTRGKLQIDTPQHSLLNPRLK